MTRECQVRICERLGVKFPGPTRRVSRASPVQTAMRNCTRDEGRSSEAGSQVLASNRCKLLSSKAMVVSLSNIVQRVLPDIFDADDALGQCVEQFRSSVFENCAVRYVMETHGSCHGR